MANIDINAITAFLLKNYSGEEIAKLLDKINNSEQFTKEEKDKLATIAAYANRYSHPTGDGNYHVPANGDGNGGNFLYSDESAGEYYWKKIQIKDIDGLAGNFSKVTDSEINGNILVDGEEIEVYKHPNSQHLPSYPDAVGNEFLKIDSETNAPVWGGIEISDVMGLGYKIDGLKFSEDVTKNIDAILSSDDKLALKGKDGRVLVANDANSQGYEYKRFVIKPNTTYLVSGCETKHDLCHFLMYGENRNGTIYWVALDNGGINQKVDTRFENYKTTSPSNAGYLYVNNRKDLGSIVVKEITNHGELVVGMDNFDNEVAKLFKKLDGIAEGATKVEKSEANGSILVNSKEIVVYEHPTGDGYHHLSEKEKDVLADIDTYVDTAVKNAIGNYDTDSLGNEVVNSSTHYDFPSVGNVNTIYKAESERLLYQWNPDSLSYEVLNIGGESVDTKITLINGGNASTV